MGDNHAMKRGWGDIALAVVVIAVVAMMIVPLPRMAIDLLLAVSITSSVLVLLAAVYAPTPARLSTLPTILLVTTLFRLGLNVSTTRRILSHGDGGDVVQAFGSFVAQADLVVGLVVFAVITVVQYVVVARGAERVAEVAARFALDGLPGTDEELIALVSAQAEPHQARWIAAHELPSQLTAGAGPGGGSFEDWSQLAVRGMFGG